MDTMTKDLYKAITAQKYHDANVILDELVEQMIVERIKSVLTPQEDN